MTEWKTEQDFFNKDCSREFRHCMYAIGCDFGRIEINKHYHYNGSGNKFFGGAEKWPVLVLEIDFETGKEKERDKLAEQLKEFMDKAKPAQSIPAENRYGREHDIGCPHHPEIILDGQLGECTCKSEKVKPECDNCVYLEADKEIINGHIEKIIRLEARLKKPENAKPLAQYLSEYFDHEQRANEENCGFIPGIDVDFRGQSVSVCVWELKAMLEQALDVYQETENVKIRIEKV